MNTTQYPQGDVVWYYCCYRLHLYLNIPLPYWTDARSSGII